MHAGILVGAEEEGVAAAGSADHRQGAFRETRPLPEASRPKPSGELRISGPYEYFWNMF